MHIGVDRQEALSKWVNLATNRELRTTYKLIERDLHYHCGRLNLLGTNQLLKRYGMYNTLIWIHVDEISSC